MTFLEWIEKTPWAMRTLGALILLMSPILYTVIAWIKCWEDIKDAYRTAWTAVKTGKDPE